MANNTAFHFNFSVIFEAAQSSQPDSSVQINNDDKMIFIIITLNISRVAENGRTAMPTSRSATAKLTIKKFVTLLNLCEQNTAAMTRQLPTITNTLINAKNASDIKFSNSVHCTESISVQLLIARRDNYVGMLDLVWPPVFARENHGMDKNNNTKRLMYVLRDVVYTNLHLLYLCFSNTICFGLNLFVSFYWYQNHDISSLETARCRYMV